MAEDVILDVDPGVDDALALLMALASPELHVLAITVVNGNVPVAIGAGNASAVAAFAGRSDVPVLTGAAKPLVREPVHVFEVHGERGLGKACLPPGRPPAPGAVEAIVRTLSERPGRVSIAAVGPLTNLAMAERQAPGVLEKAARIVVMGGAIDVPGNSSPVAEYNFLADPHAAHAVMASGANLTLVPLDVTTKVGMDEAEIARRIGSLETPRARFFLEATAVVVELGRKRGGYAGVHLHDPTAIAFMLRPDLFEQKTFHLTVEPDGRYTAGQVVVDRREGVSESRRVGTPTSCAMTVDEEGVMGLFLERALDHTRGEGRR